MKYIGAINKQDEFYQAEEDLSFWVKDIPNYIYLQRRFQQWQHRQK